MFEGQETQGDKPKENEVTQSTYSCGSTQPGRRSYGGNSQFRMTGNDVCSLKGLLMTSHEQSVLTT